MSDLPELGLTEYAHRLFVIHDGNTIGQCYDDPADAIAAAEDLAEHYGVEWYVTALAQDDCFLHIARPKKKPAKKKKRSTDAKPTDG